MNTIYYYRYYYWVFGYVLKFADLFLFVFLKQIQTLEKAKASLENQIGNEREGLKESKTKIEVLFYSLLKTPLF